MKEYQEYSDSQLLTLIAEKNEDAENILFAKYKYIIDLLVNKYRLIAKKYKIEYQDIYQISLIAYYEAIDSYNEKLSSLPTFITLCINRKINSFLTQISTIKNRLNLSNISLEYITNDNIDYLLKNDTNNPYYIIAEKDNLNTTLQLIKNLLSKKEKEVFILFINGYSYVEIANIFDVNKKKIDNTIQRIKRKIKKLLV